MIQIYYIILVILLISIKRIKCINNIYSNLILNTLIISNSNNNSKSSNTNNNKSKSISDGEVSMTFRRPKDRNNNNNNNNVNSGNNRREQTRDLKRLIQELEESDYGNYGSWGNFRARNRAQAQQQVQEDDQDSIATRELYQDVSLEDESNIVSDYDLSDIEHIYLEKANGLQRSTSIDNNIRSDDEGSLSSREFSLRRDTWRRLVDDDTLREFDPNNYLASDTVLKVSGLIVLGTVLSYISVCPRTLPLIEYNSEYKASLLRITSATTWPCILLAIVYRGKDANINRVIDTFTTSIIIGYPILCIIEAILATVIRLIIIRIFEPDAFKLCPRVPALLLPWRLTVEGYFPSRVTLVLFSICNNCIMAPIVEELFKARILIQALRKNAKTSTPKNDLQKVNTITPPALVDANGQAVSGVSKSDTNSESNRPSSLSIQPHQQRYLDFINRKWVTIRTYVIFMLAASLGLKVMDNTRRILLYAYPHQRHKSFFAVARSFFPVQELCGAMTALALGKRDLIGHKISLFEAIRPAIFLHVMASLRGVKPMFVWNSHRPWDEIQLQAWNAADNSPPQQLFLSGAMNMLWFIVIIKSLTNVIQQFVVYSREYFIKLRNDLENL